tara:strand:+ start:935 stop:1144 length:210 start_codon:yes stop_codon:yes gene_type:complete
MIFKNARRIFLSATFIFFILVGCKSTVDEVTMYTCKAVETNIAKCSQLIADDISDANANTLSSVNEGNL